jgi:hypothetical protein
MKPSLALKALLAMFAVLTLAACGSHTPSVTVTTPRGVTTTEALTTACPPGAATMGCASGAPATYSAQPPPGVRASEVPAGVKFPDVSAYQGCSIDWSAVGAPGGVLKLGEGNYEHDSCASHNVAELRAAKKAVLVYWFMRPVGATSEAAYIVAALKAQHLTISHVVEYTSPGTYSGGGCLRLLWIAAYSGGAHPPNAPCSTSLKGWQYTDDGHVAGLGYGDLSVDYGMLAYAPHVLILDTEVPGLSGYDAPVAAYVLKHDPAAKAKPHKVKPTPAALVCFGPHRSHSGKCAQLRRPAFKDLKAVRASYRQYNLHGCAKLERGKQTGRVRSAERRGACGQLRQRVRYFKAAEAKIVNAYS